MARVCKLVVSSLIETKTAPAPGGLVASVFFREKLVFNFNWSGFIVAGKMQTLPALRNMIKIGKKFYSLMSFYFFSVSKCFFCGKFELCRNWILYKLCKYKKLWEKISRLGKGWRKRKESEWERKINTDERLRDYFGKICADLNLRGMRSGKNSCSEKLTDCSGTSEFFVLKR